MPDFECSNHGSIWLLTPMNENAQDWCDEHLPDDAPMHGVSYGIEARYAEPIILGIRDDGLTVEAP